MKTRIFFSFFLFSMAMLSYPAMAQITITLDRAEINGQDITTSRQIVVQPGEPLLGYLEVTVNNREIGTVPVAATPNWWWNGFGSNADTFTRLSQGVSVGQTSIKYELRAGMSAPYDPGIYYIGVFAGEAEDEAHVMSCDKSNGRYDWNTYPEGGTNALDVSYWSSVYWNQAVSGDGSVRGFKFCSGPTCIIGSYGGAAIMVEVAAGGGVAQEIRLSPAADTYVSAVNMKHWHHSRYELERNLNFGTSRALAVVRGLHGHAGSYRFWKGSLLQFDLTPVPAGATLSEARLFLHAYLCSRERISVHRMNREWNEAEASWLIPFKGADPWWQDWSNGGNYEPVATDTQVIRGKGWFSWDVTEDVRSFLGGAPNYGWFLKSAQTSGSDLTPAAFQSKEGRNEELRPYLLLKFTASDIFW